MDKLNGAAIMPYNIAETGENDVEINMYGEIVEAVPTDFWTGEPIEGNFIAVDRFLRDLDDLKDKKNITVHINSVGGDLYGGIAIYNRLKALPGNVTTVNDGLPDQRPQRGDQTAGRREQGGGQRLRRGERPGAGGDESDAG